MFQLIPRFSKHPPKNVVKHEFLTGKDVLPEKGLLEKAATIKKSEYLSLGRELIKKTYIAKNNIKDKERFMNLTKRKMMKQ